MHLRPVGLEAAEAAEATSRPAPGPGQPHQHSGPAEATTGKTFGKQDREASLEIRAAKIQEPVEFRNRDRAVCADIQEPQTEIPGLRRDNSGARLAHVKLYGAGKSTCRHFGDSRRSVHYRG